MQGGGQVKNIVVVGGLPHPIGGVTTFISRLVKSERSVSVLFDLYPSAHKELPAEYCGNYIYSGFKIITVLKLFLYAAIKKNLNVHFNFSTPRSLMLLRWLPKKKSKWALTLHHGNLGKMQPWMARVLSRKVDVFLPLNSTQQQWYSSVGVQKIVSSSSYLPAGEPLRNRDLQAEIIKYRNEYDRIIICSGYPTDIYNHEVAYELMALRSKDLLICCLYGPGGLRDKLIKLSDGKNIIVKDSLDENGFNFLLKNSDLYLRLNSEDSFGIAVADAVNFGVRVIATNVCARYPGAIIIPVGQSISELNEVVQRTFESPLMDRSDMSMPKFEYSRVFK